MRTKIERLETASAKLKAKGREANRTAKASNRRIAELENQVVQLQGELTAASAPVVSPTPSKTVRRGRQPALSKGADSGDAAPPGVAVAEPEPMDEEAIAARSALEENLSGE